LIADLTQAASAARLAADGKQNELDDKSAEIAILQGQESEMETVTIPELTQIRDEAQNILDGIDAQLAQAQDRSGGCQSRRTRRSGNHCPGIGRDGSNQAGRSGGFRNHYRGRLNIKLLNGGTIGETDNSLGVTAAGTVTITTGAGTSVYGLYLESGGDLYLAPVTVDGEVVIDSLGDIKASLVIRHHYHSGQCSAQQFGRGHRGSARSASDKRRRLSAVGEKVYIKNLKDLIVDTVTGDTVISKRQGT
jgi:hypothetical protein